MPALRFALLWETGLAVGGLLPRVKTGIGVVVLSAMQLESISGGLVQTRMASVYRDIAVAIQSVSFTVPPRSPSPHRRIESVSRGRCAAARTWSLSSWGYGLSVARGCWRRGRGGRRRTRMWMCLSKPHTTSGAFAFRGLLYYISPDRDTYPRS
ncbi:hypothetical protein B0H16DRAFT_242024 [Mycena metata]|uniref:Uncharacterized protein n=1 Tax=Mycena metata TaxID=1033252 RepID=A0AAD7HUC2_9AGAR|nr:hypothetical protein B0H16DRAFT_242024 [Mycena metata]